MQTTGAPFSVSIFFGLLGFRLGALAGVPTIGGVAGMWVTKIVSVSWLSGDIDTVGVSGMLFYGPASVIVSIHYTEFGPGRLLL